MAKPRVFISSTFYDLRQIRENMERFVKEIGYEPVRYETGAIPYEKDKPLESSAYKEVELCDIIVSIIGGRFGTESGEDERYSITQNEIRRALDRGVQVYIFVEQTVLSEFDTYKLNKENDSITYSAVDDKRIFTFLEQLYALPQNNPITGFQTSEDIIEYLRSQWAGLFQRFLEKQQQAEEVSVLDDIKTTARTLKELVEYLSKESKGKDRAIENILMANHPAFTGFAKITATKYRVYFSNKRELDSWLKARGYIQIDPESLDEGSVYEWQSSTKEDYIILTENIFDEDGDLKIYTEKEWDNTWLGSGEYLMPPEDEDLPF